MSIFKYELKYWLKNPVFYAYCAAFFGLAFIVMAGAANVFDGDSADTTLVANSSSSLFQIFTYFNKLLLFLLPAIVGHTIYKDFSSEMYRVMYSFPFSKMEYLASKFLSGFLMVAVIAFMANLGLIAATMLPMIDPVMLVDFDVKSYAHIFFLYSLPSLFLFGSVVFAVVTLSRNIYAGFITIIVLMSLREILIRLSAGADWALYAEPFGEAFKSVLTKHWDISEKNSLNLPINAGLLLNRGIAIGLGLLSLLFTFRNFSFNEQPFSFFKKSSSGKRVTKDNFGSIIKVNLPEVDFNFSGINRLRTAWHLSNVDFFSIVKSGSFLSLFGVGSVAVLAIVGQMNPQYDATLLPTTWFMLAFPMFFYGMLVTLMTFLFAGQLVHKGKKTQMDMLIDASPVPNWVLFLSKFLALIKIQILLLSAIMVVGIAVQLANGFYDVQIGHYLFDLFVIHLISLVTWGFLALIVQTLFKNAYLGFFLLMLFYFISPDLGKIGLDSLVFQFNKAPNELFFMRFSDLSKYGVALAPFLLYKSYWLLGGLCLGLISLLFWRREKTHTIRERIAVAAKRLRSPIGVGLGLVFIAFLSFGFWIFAQEQAVKKPGYGGLSSAKKYDHFQFFNQPRCTAVDLKLDIFPEENSFQAKGSYCLVNKSDKAIDSLLLSYPSGMDFSYSYSRPTRTVLADSIAHFDILQLETSLVAGDSLVLHFEAKSHPHTMFSEKPLVASDGTYFSSLMMPEVGFYVNTMDTPISDSLGKTNHYRSIFADFIDFDVQISTSKDQIALTTGVLEKEWTEGNRRFFQYKSDGHATCDFPFHSGKFEVARDTWQGVDLEIYYHKGHEINLKSIMEGAKAALAYNSEHYGMYPHSVLRIVEYSRTYGDDASAFSTLISMSEMGFIVETPEGAGILDFALIGAAHEASHLWWGHQITPADVMGTRMLTESMADYLSLKILEKNRGQEAKQKLLNLSHKTYFKNRRNETEPERPLMYNRGLSRGYVPYKKGMIVFNSLCEYLGEKPLNQAIRSFFKKNKYRSAPYATTADMVAEIRAVTPDSLAYLIEDMFENVTFYNNKLNSFKTKKLEDGRYQVDIDFLIRKYRVDSAGTEIRTDKNGDQLKYRLAPSDKRKGITTSLPLNDYIEIGVFGEKPLYEVENALFLQKIKVERIKNSLRLILDEKPTAVWIDPYGLLLDGNRRDNVGR